MVDFASSRSARKLYLLGGEVAFAVSGSEDEIIDCLTSMRPMLSYCLSQERPLKPVSDHVNGYEGDVQLIGAHIRQGDPTKIHKVHPENRFFENAIFGECASVGSGQNYLQGMVGQFMANSQPSLHGMLLADVYEFIRGTSAALSSRILSDELLLPEAGSRTFGGFLECFYYNSHDGKWSKGFKSLHLHFIARRAGDSEFVFGMVPRAVAYDPTGIDGRIITLSVDEAGGVSVEMDLKNILEDDNNRIGMEEFWKNWFPDSCTISVFVEWASEGAHISKTLELFEMNHVYLEIGKKLRFGVSDEILAPIIKAIEKNFNISHRK